MGGGGGGGKMVGVMVTEVGLGSYRCISMLMQKQLQIQLALLNNYSTQFFLNF